MTKIMNRQWNIVSVPYFPPNFQQALTYARSKVLRGIDEDLNLLGCHNKSTGQQLTFWRSTLPPPSKCSIPLFLNQYALMMETAYSSRTLVTTYQQTKVPTLKTWILMFNLVLYFLYHFRSLWIPTLKCCLLLLISKILPCITCKKNNKGK